MRMNFVFLPFITKLTKRERERERESSREREREQ